MDNQITRLPSGDDELAVAITEGAEPTVLWLGGFRSDMDGTKALALAEWGAGAGRRVVRFDYRGHGRSGGRFEDFALSDWLADATRVQAAFCPDATVAVGSSMGGWIALLMAKAALAHERPFAGMVLIAPAADFTERLMWPRLPPDVQRRLMDEGIIHIPSEYGDPYPVTRRLIEDGRQHCLYGDNPIEVGCPIHILQGIMDADVPHGHTMELVERLATDDVVLTLVKDGDHRLSRPEDLARMVAAVENVTRQSDGG